MSESIHVAHVGVYGAILASVIAATGAIVAALLPVAKPSTVGIVVSILALLPLLVIGGFCAVRLYELLTK